MKVGETIVNNIKNKKIIIWGTGKDSVKATARLKEQGLQVAKYVTGSGPICNPLFMGKEITLAEECLGRKDLFFVVAVRDIYWQEVRRKLTGSGYREFEDFVYWKVLDPHRKMVMLHGNCHLDKVNDYLESSAEFNERYWIYPYKRVCEIGDITQFESAIRLTDVWIYQHIRPENSICYEISDEYTLPMLKKDALKISVPNYYHLGKILYPQTKINNPNNPPLKEGRDGNGLFPRSDMIIDRWVEEHPDGFEFKDLLEYCFSDNAFAENEIKENYELIVEKIIDRDKNCDIKASGYILDNFKNEQMFYDLGHPTNAVFRKIAAGILEKLGIEDTEDIYCEEGICYHEDPVYPQVKRVLGLNWEKKYIRETDISKKIRDRMDMEEYIREYLYWCYSMDHLSD